MADTVNIPHGEAMRIVTCNARRQLHAEAAEHVVRIVTAYADVVLWQELETPAHRFAVDQLPGWSTYWPGGAANAVAISYRDAVVARVRVKRKRRVHRGEAGVTPARYIVRLVFDDPQGRTWPLINTHKISQAWTSHPERRRRWRRHARMERRRVASMLFWWGRVIGGGDQNRNRWSPAGTDGHWAALGTLGRDTFYDVLYTAGDVELVDGPRRIRTPSDHDALWGRFRVG